MKLLSTGLLFSIVVAPLLSLAGGYNISGKIMKPDGEPLQESSVSFSLEVTNPAGNCVLYREQINGIDMSTSKGAFHIVLGMGTKSFPAAPLITVDKILSNKAALDCDGGATWTPSYNDERSLRIAFYNGTGWVTFAARELKAVPFATESKNADVASKLETYSAQNFLRVDGANLTPLTGAQVTSMLAVADGTSNNYVKPSSLPTCGAGTYLAYNGTSFSCETLPTLSMPAGTNGQFLKYNAGNWQGSTIALSDVTGLVTTLSDKVNKANLPSCTANQTLGYVSVSDTWQCTSIVLTLNGDVTGTHTAATVAKIRGVAVATTAPNASQVLQYDGTQWVPANLPASAVSSVAAKTGAVTLDYGDINSAASKYLTYKPNNVACADGQVMKWVSANSRWECAADTDTNGGGSVTSVTAGTGLSGGSITTTGTISLANTAVTAGSYTRASITVDAQGRLTAASSGPAISLTADVTGMLPIANGGTGASTAIAAFNGLSPSTTKGDLIVNDGTNDIRLPAGTNGQVLSANSAQASGLQWITIPSGTVTGVSSGNSYLTVTNGTTTPVVTLNVGTAAATVAAGNDSRFTDARTPTGTATGDLSGTYPAPVVAKIQGKPVDVSAGYADGDTLVYDAANAKWKLKKVGCDAGFNKVNVGVPTCIKAYDGVSRNFALSVNACGDLGANLCTQNELINACRDGKLTIGGISWSNDVYLSEASILQCSSGPTWSMGSMSMTSSYLTYCCKPINN